MSGLPRACSPLNTRALIAIAATVGLAIGGAFGCADDDDGAIDLADARTATARTPSIIRDGEWQRVAGLRGTRYCEVLLLRIVDARLNGEVWNTITRSDCPQAEWEALDMNAIKAEHGAVAALRNGPRFWLTDAIERKVEGAPTRVAVFGTLEMGLGATVDLGAIPPDLSAYKERIVARQTVFEYETGAQIYELRRSDGTTYVMQSYSLQADPSLTESALAGLASRLELPEGWTYAARTLEAPLRVMTSPTGATVIQDSLSNTYQRLVDE